MSYEGLTVRVRGFVDRMGGPEIEVASPTSIEVVRESPEGAIKHAPKKKGPSFPGPFA